MSSGKSVFGVIAYNQQKVDAGKAKILSSQGIIAEDKEGHPDMPAIIRSFETHLINNQNTKKPILHISLNPHPDDKLTDEQLNQIGKEYLQKMGYENQPFIIFKHEDIDRHHIHIVTLRTDAEGKKIDDSYEHFRSKQATIEIEEKYKLHQADKKEKNTQEDHNIKKIEISKGNVKKQVASLVKLLSRNYKYASLNEFRALLNFHNLTFEEIKGQHDNIPYHGIVYYVTDDKGNKISLPFKASHLGKNVQAKALLKNIENSKIQLKAPATKQYLAEAIKEAISNCHHNRKKFEKFLQNKSINVVFRENDEGRIYGATFIDHSHKVVLNGSRLGKDFSANIFEQLFNDNKKESTNVTEQQRHPSGQSYISNGHTETLSALDIFSLFDLPTQNQADQTQPPMPKKKKKRRKKMD